MNTLQLQIVVAEIIQIAVIVYLWRRSNIFEEKYWDCITKMEEQK